MLNRARSVLAKGPAHLFNLGAYFGGQLAQQINGAWRPSAVNEAAFLAALTPARERRAAAQHFRARVQPRFFFQSNADPGPLEHINPATRQQCLAAAQAICRGEFEFRGEPPITFPNAVDWFYRPGTNTDWTWELNRHAYFATLGRAYAYTRDRRFLESFSRLAQDWLRQNPPGVRAPNWASVLEVAYRANSWLWALYHFRADLEDDTLLAVVRGLWLMGRYLAANLEYTSPNNHLLLEAKALAMLGLLFPEFRDAGQWHQLGERVLWAEVRRQVHPDGGHAEQASLYHQIITSELLEYLWLLAVNERLAPEDVRLRVMQMLEFERGLLKPNGEMPLYGDSALGDSYVRFKALAAGAILFNRLDLGCVPMDEATFWLTGGKTMPVAPAPQESCAFPDSGFFVMRAGAGPAATYLLFDCGPFGYAPAPGHGHADALSFELHLGGQTLIVDPGVYSYHAGAQWRNYFRGTAAHNTIRVDGQDQSLLQGEMRVVRPAKVKLHAWVSMGAYDFVDGAHDGYTRLARPVVHRRQILFIKPDYWIVFDQLLGQGRHEIELLFHFAPEATVARCADDWLAIHCGESELRIAPLQRPAPAEWRIISGQEVPVQGWVSRYSGQKYAAPVAHYTLTADLPLHFVTLLWPGAGDGTVCPKFEQLEVRDDAGRALIEPMVSALRLEMPCRTDLIVLDRREVPGRKHFGGQTSAGRVFWARHAQGHWSCRVWGATVAGSDL